MTDKSHETCIGTRVRLVSGGPVMTVLSVRHDKEKVVVHCVWFDVNRKLCWCEFPQEALVHSPSEDVARMENDKRDQDFADAINSLIKGTPNPFFVHGGMSDYERQKMAYEQNRDQRHMFQSARTWANNATPLMGAAAVIPSVLASDDDGP